MFKDNGYLSASGEDMINPIKDSLQSFLSSDVVNNMSIAELQTLGANLSRLIGNSIFEKIIQKKK